ncbi:MAG: NADPH-dependent assimilatory sulfite reductase hemoprotein subunit [Nitrospiraceae bacterium]|nr:NADPH-dependent assimilatory sulfite reductase hemoprotein subunit [Nitrospiraceae bacterium]
MANKDLTITGSERSELERIKEGSAGLLHPIDDDLGHSSPCFSNEGTQLLKHHGVYQQTDRDSLAERRRNEEEPLYRFMVRIKLPGGRLSAESYLACDELADRYGQGDLRVTSRQGLQLHGMTKSSLRPVIHDLNKVAHVSTWGAAGDVARNTLAPPVAGIDQRFGGAGREMAELAGQISDRFLPHSNAYFDLWVDDSKVASISSDGQVSYEALQSSTVPEPLYGGAYLPRKFKVAICTDFDNSVDALINDVGLIAVIVAGGVSGYEVVVGGGLGFSGNDPSTYARLASPFAFVSADQVIPLLEAILIVFRDHGDRCDRNHARLKYLIDKWGIDDFRSAVQERVGFTLQRSGGVTPNTQPHYLGWAQQVQPGLNYLGIWLENGRIKDFDDGRRYKSGLRAVVERFEPEVRLTPQHNLILSGIGDEDVGSVNNLLKEFGIPSADDVAPIRRHEMACPSFPLCGRAMAEAERVMPSIMGSLERSSFADEEVVIRISGCRNGCSRPRTAEIGILGKRRRGYLLYTGGDAAGTRLNELLLEDVGEEELGAVLLRLLDLWTTDRCEGERFGTWSRRIGVTALKDRLAPDW